MFNMQHIEEVRSLLSQNTIPKLQRVIELQCRQLSLTFQHLNQKVCLEQQTGHPELPGFKIREVQDYFVYYQRTSPGNPNNYSTVDNVRYWRELSLVQILNNTRDSMELTIPTSALSYEDLSLLYRIPLIILDLQGQVIYEPDPLMFQYFLVDVNMEKVFLAHDGHFFEKIFIAEPSLTRSESPRIETTSQPLTPGSPSIQIDTSIEANSIYEEATKQPGAPRANPP